MLLVATVLVGLASLFLAVLAGRIDGEFGERRRRFERESRLIGPMLSNDRAFAGIGLEMYTGDGSAYLVGDVEAEGDYERLRTRMGVLLGSSSEIDRMCGVTIRGRTPAAVPTR